MVRITIAWQRALAHAVGLDPDGGAAPLAPIGLQNPRILQRGLGGHRLTDAPNLFSYLLLGNSIPSGEALSLNEGRPNPGAGQTCTSGQPPSLKDRNACSAGVVATSLYKSQLCLLSADDFTLNR